MDGKSDLKNPLEKRLGYQLRRASVLMMAALTDRLADLALKPVEASILILIQANPAITQTEIGRVLAIQRANMVPLVAGLMERKLIGRQAADGRSHALHLTPAGRLLTAKAETAMLDHENRFFGEFSAGDRERLLAQLNEIRTGKGDSDA